MGSAIPFIIPYLERDSEQLIPLFSRLDGIINCLKVEKEISAIQSEIDSLDMKKQELVSFSRISSIATSKGYNYRQSSVAANIVGVNVNE